MELPASWLLTAETQFFQAASQSAIILSLLFLYKAMLLLYKAIILRLLLQGHHPDWACSARRRFLRSDSLAFFLSLRARSLNSSNVRGWLNFLPPRRTILSSGGTRDSRQATFASATNLCSSKVSVLAFHRISSLSFFTLHLQLVHCNAYDHVFRFQLLQMQGMNLGVEAHHLGRQGFSQAACACRRRGTRSFWNDRVRRLSVVVFCLTDSSESWSKGYWLKTIPWRYPPYEHLIWAPVFKMKRAPSQYDKRKK